MDKEIQKFILVSLKERGYCDLERTIIEDVNKKKWKNNSQIPSEQIIRHQAKILRDKGLINFVENHGVYFEMTLLGELYFSPWYVKAWRWFLYDKNNFYTILSVLISLSAIIISVIALNK